MSDKLEQLSEYIHEEMWTKWAKIMLDQEPNISEERRKRWNEECFIPYNELTEEMKEIDRIFARKILAIMSE
jgi:hypothetical protein